MRGPFFVRRICDHAFCFGERRVAQSISTIHACVDSILQRCGNEIRMAMPLGLGKPNVLFNALYERIVADPQKRLTIYTALSLARPRVKNDLEKRFIGPFMARHLGADYPDLEYVAAQQENRLPKNVRVHEFY